MSKKQVHNKLYSMGEGSGSPTRQWLDYLASLKDGPIQDIIIPSRSGGYASLFGTIPGPDTLLVQPPAKVSNQ